MNSRAKLAMLKAVLTRRSPVYVQFALSKRCNLKCAMCRAVESRKQENELNLSQIDKLAAVLAKLGAGIVILTGGEPLLRQDLDEIVRIFTRKGLEVRLQTNGILAAEEKVASLVSAGLREVTLSLDTLDADKQDMINNQQGSWDKIIRSLALFSHMLPKKANISGVNTVVSAMNISEIPKIIKFVSRIGFYSSLIPVHLSCSGIPQSFIIRGSDRRFEFTGDNFGLIDRTYAKVIEMKKQGYFVQNSFRFLKESRAFLKYGRVKWPCDSPYLYFSISPGGYFLPCVDLQADKSMLDDDFIEVFRSKEFKRKVRSMVEKCAGCFYACYPEITYFCRDFKTFFERTCQGWVMSRRTRVPVDYEDSLKLAERINQEP